jgi:anaerobic selenocysteine-containing dehydrogenase
VSVDRTGKQGHDAHIHPEGNRAANALTFNRRDWLRAAVGGSVGLAHDGLLDLPTVRAATQKLKLANVREFTTSCNFCSCGCGMIAAVREGKLSTIIVWSTTASKNGDSPVHETPFLLQRDWQVRV